MMTTLLLYIADVLLVLALSAGLLWFLVFLMFLGDPLVRCRRCGQRLYHHGPGPAVHALCHPRP